MNINELLESKHQEYVEKYYIDPDSVTHLERFLASVKSSLKTEEDKCPMCNASMKAHWHRLSPILVTCLLKARECVLLNNKNKFHLREDLNLTKVEYNNFQKLRFFGLIAHYQENGKRIDGAWLLTRRGSQFLNGSIKLNARVKTFRNRIVEKDSTLVSVGQVMGSNYVDKVTDMESEVIDFMTIGTDLLQA